MVVVLIHARGCARLRNNEYNYRDSLQARAIEGIGHCSTKIALSWRDIRYTIYDARSNNVLKLFTPFVLKEWKDFCLLNLIECIKYNFSLSFML